MIYQTYLVILIEILQKCINLNHTGVINIQFKILIFVNRKGYNQWFNKKYQDLPAEFNNRTNIIAV